MEVRLPPLAEGADSGTVVNVLVSAGDAVRKDQTLLELENQKAVAPIPSPSGGVVAQIHVKQGDIVSVGQLLVTLQEGAPARAVPSPQPAGEQAASSKSGFPPPASPSLRKMAAELGLDLARLQGSGRGGRITLEDMRAHLERLQAGSAAAPGAAERKSSAPEVDFSQWGPVERKPFTPLRQAIARAMEDSWTRIPHVTQFDEADVTVMTGLIEKHAPSYEKRGAKLTLTALLIRALALTLKKHPVFNSSLNEQTQEIVFKQYVHIGIAVDTEGGLIVPVLRDADRKGILELAKGLQDLAERTRARKISSSELQGGSFTLSNQGGIGGGHFTPIIHWPEVAILGVGRAKPKLPLSLSYDHRVTDGANAARFIRDLVQALETFPEKEVVL